MHQKKMQEVGGAAKWTWDPEKSLELGNLGMVPILLQLPIPFTKENMWPEVIRLDLLPWVNFYELKLQMLLILPTCSF